MNDLIDSIDFAVLSRIQELGNRFGLKPYHFVARLDHSADEHVLGMGVQFDILTDAAKNSKEFEKIMSNGTAMLKAIGVDENNHLVGGEIAVLDALDAALQKSPAPKPVAR